MFRKQFLFTKSNIDLPDLNQVNKVGDHTLYIGQDSVYNSIKNENRELHLLGSLYSHINDVVVNNFIYSNIVSFSITSIYKKIMTPYP